MNPVEHANVGLRINIILILKIGTNDTLLVIVKLVKVQIGPTQILSFFINIYRAKETCRNVNYPKCIIFYFI